MLGRDHALSGALAFAVLGPALHVTGSHLAAGVLLTTGPACCRTSTTRTARSRASSAS